MQVRTTLATVADVRGSPRVSKGLSVTSPDSRRTRLRIEHSCAWVTKAIPSSW
jgi:hypothetical protein